MVNRGYRIFWITWINGLNIIENQPAFVVETYEWLRGLFKLENKFLIFTQIKKLQISHEFFEKMTYFWKIFKFSWQGKA